MKKIWTVVSNHILEDYKLAYYGSVSIFLIIILSINFSLNLENGIIDAYTGEPVRILLFLVLNAGVYYSACCLVSWFQKDWRYWQLKKFWILSLFGLTVLSLDRGFPYLHELADWLSLGYEMYAWIYKVANHSLSFLLVFIPLLIFYSRVDKTQSSFYGLTKASSLKPYIALLCVVAPLIGIATVLPGFLAYYPMYKPNSVAEFMGWEEYVPVLIFEFFYGADFINVELLFRGFFVIGMAQVLGKNAILPMVTIYCVLHFGKPLGEAISSIAGGYILGVIAYSTQSIWGGILIHIGVAWLMELAAYLAKHF